MARTVFVLLLLANGCYWYWANFLVEDNAVTAVQAVKSPASLILLPEATQKPASRKPEPAPENSAQVEGGVEADAVAQMIEEACWGMGEFADRATADKLANYLKENQLQVSYRTLQKKGKTDYWVHIGPFSSTERGLQVLKQLRGRNIDSFLISEGELKNAISLGYFTQRSSAKKMMAQRKGIGYPVRLYEAEHVEEHYEVYALGRIDQPAIAELTAQYPLKLKPYPVDKKTCN